MDPDRRRHIYDWHSRLPLIHLELLDYRLQFADRGLLMTRRGIKAIDLSEYVRAEP